MNSLGVVKLEFSAPNPQVIIVYDSTSCNLIDTKVYLISEKGI